MRPRRHPIRPDLARPRRGIRTLAVGAAACLALVAAACGDDESGPIPQTGEVETTTTTEATTTTAAPTTAPDEGERAEEPTTAPGDEGEGNGESTTTAGGEEPTG